jgi:hypothetical protein
MPPPAIKTVRDLIFWQYSKIIAESAEVGKANYGFIMGRVQEAEKLRNKLVNVHLRIHQGKGGA